MALDGGTVVIDVQAKFNNGMSPGIDKADSKVDKFTESISDAEGALGRLSGKRNKLDIDDEATRKVNKFMQTTKQFAGKTFKSTVRIVDYATKPLRAIKDSLFSIKGLVAAVGSGMAFNAGVLNPISIADKDTQSEIFFNTLLGEGKGADFVKQIEGIAKSSSMDYDASMSAVQSMLGMGWNQDTVLSDLQTLIDTSAALGGGPDKLGGIALALSQIKSKGKLSTEELNQLAERGVNAKGILAEQLGYGSGDAALMKLSKDLEQGNIGSEAAIEALMTGLKDAYSGIDAETARSTAGGIMSQIKDTFKIDVVKRWGKGIQDGAVKSLGHVLDLVEENDELITKLGDSFYDLGKSLSGKFASGVEKVSKRLLKVLKSPEFENASFGGKIKILWDEVIANPFSEWWDSTGKTFFEKKAGELGKSLGTGFSNGLLGILGFDVTGATEDGLSIGSAFCEGFIDGIDTEAIKDALAKAFKDAAKDALKVLPGGDSPTTSSWISAIVLGALGKKLGLGKLLGKGGNWLSKSWEKTYGSGTSGGSSAAGKSGGWLSKLTGSSWLTGSADDLLTSGGKLGTFLGKLGKFGKGTGKFLKGNWLSLLFSGAAIASSDDKVKTTVEQGAGLAGSAAGGALGGKVGATIGSFIAPGAGTAVGGGIGSLLGSFLGYMGAETGAGKLWEKAKTWWYGDYDQDEGIFAGGGRDFFKQWWGSTKDNAKEVGGMAKGSWNKTKEWFTGDYDPEKGLLAGGGLFDFVKESWDSTMENFTTNINLVKTDLIDPAAAFFTETLPGWFDEKLGVVETFFSETLPEWFNEKLEPMDTFFAETLPEWWGEKMDAISVFFEETLPEWWEEKVEAVGTFFEETLPEWWEEKIGLVETFFTETLPGWFEEAVDNFVSYWTVDVPAYWNGKADEIASGWGDVKQYFKDKADELVGWFNEKKEEVKTAWEGSTVKKGIDTGVSWVKEKLGIEGEHATGGIFSRPHVGLVAEDGPEAIIPLGGKRRQRGLDLWEKAGRALGVTPYANGGIVGNIPAGGGGNSIQVDVGGVHIHVDGGNATLLEALNSQSEEIKEAIAGILYDALSKNFNNMPITI